MLKNGRITINLDGTIRYPFFVCLRFVHTTSSSTTLFAANNAPLFHWIFLEKNLKKITVRRAFYTCFGIVQRNEKVCGLLAFRSSYVQTIVLGCTFFIWRFNVCVKREFIRWNVIHLCERILHIYVCLCGKNIEFSIFWRVNKTKLISLVRRARVYYADRMWIDFLLYLCV